MPGLLLPDGSYHDSSAPAEAPEQEAVDPEVALADAHEALESETAEAAEPETAEAAEPEITPCVTAFTVYLMDDGEVVVSLDLLSELVPQRPPTFDDMTHGCSVLSWHVENYAYRLPGEATTGCVTAFTPYLTHDGRWLVSADLNDAILPDRTPTDDELVGALAVVRRDIQTQEIGQVIINAAVPTIVQNVVHNVVPGVIQGMMQFGKAMRDQTEAQNVAAKLEADKARRAGG